jgi:hypothetical protein
MSTTLSKRTSRTLSGLSITFAVFLTALALAPMAHAGSSDYNFGATPMNLCVNPGVNGVSAISVTSGTFKGTLNLAYSIDYVVANSPTLSGNPSTVTLNRGQTVSFNLTMSTNTNTPTRLYYITISDSLVTHQITIQLNVNHSCSVGGTIVPVDRLSLIAPFTNVAIYTVAIVGFASASLIYLGRRRRGTRRAE